MRFVSAGSGWKVAKIAGLPSGIKWDATNQKLKGCAAKTGTYTLTFTAAKGKTTYAETLTYKVKALPAKLVGAFSDRLIFADLPSLPVRTIFWYNTINLSTTVKRPRRK